MNLGIIAGLISFIAFIPYVISIVKRKTIPNMVTWWVWAVVGVLLFMSYKASGAINTLFVPLVYVIMPAITAIVSIKYGIGSWSKFDIACVIGAALGTIVWFITDSPVIALLLYIAIDFCGMLPTIRKTYYHPKQEDPLAWLLMCIANFINIFAGGELKFSIVVYPLYMTLFGCLIFGLSLRTIKD